MTNIISPLSFIFVSTHEKVCPNTMFAVIFEFPFVSVSIYVLVNSKSMLFVQSVVSGMPVTMNVYSSSLAFCKAINPFSFINPFILGRVYSIAVVFSIGYLAQVVISIVVVDSGSITNDYCASLHLFFFNSFCIFFLMS